MSFTLAQLRTLEQVGGQTDPFATTLGKLRVKLELILKKKII